MLPRLRVNSHLAVVKFTTEYICTYEYSIRNIVVPKIPDLTSFITGTSDSVTGNECLQRTARAVASICRIVVEHEAIAAPPVFGVPSSGDRDEARDERPSRACTNGPRGARARGPF